MSVDQQAPAPIDCGRPARPEAVHAEARASDQDDMRRKARRLAAVLGGFLALGGLLGLSCGVVTGSPPAPTATATVTLTSTPTTTPSPTPTPVPDPLTLGVISEGLQGLQQRIADEVSAFTGRVGGNFAVAVTDLQTGETVHVNGDDAARIPGCTMNFFVLLSVLRDLQAGLYPEREAGWFIGETVWSSNPGTAHYLVNKTGGGDGYAGLVKIRELLEEMRLGSAIYDHPPAAGDVVSLTPDRWQENRISALDFNRALTMLYRGELLNADWTAYLIDKMTRVKPGLNHLIPSGVTDPGARVAHKNGYIDYVPYYVDNDIGIVMFNRDGRQYAYVLTFWSQDNPWVLSDVPLGQTVSRLVWEYFSWTYPKAEPAPEG